MAEDVTATAGAVHSLIASASPAPLIQPSRSSHFCHLLLDSIVCPRDLHLLPRRRLLSSNRQRDSIEAPIESHLGNNGFILT
jgi:hypothetical protein